MAFLEVRLKGDEALKQKLRALGAAAVPAAARSLYQSGENIMSISVSQYVPVETGTLRSTAYTGIAQETRENVVVVLGYGGPAAPYALAVHENPRAGKTGGVSPGGKPYRRWAKVGEWKYLETPFKANTGRTIEKLKRDLDRAFRSI